MPPDQAPPTTETHSAELTQGQRFARIVVIILAFAAVLSNLVYPISTNVRESMEATLSNPPDHVYAYFWVIQVGFKVFALSFAGLALALATKAFHRPYARVLALGLSVIGWEPRWIQDPVIQDWTMTAVMAVFLACLLRFGALFPRPLTQEALVVSGIVPKGRWRRRVFAPWHALGRVLLSPRVVWAYALVFATLSMLPDPVTEWSNLIWFLMFVAGWGWSVNYLNASRHTQPVPEQAGILWVFLGFSALLAGLLIGPFTAWPVQALDAPAWVADITYGLVEVTGALACVACLSIATFYEGALDPGLAIRKSVLYGSLGTSLLFVFGGIELAISDAVLARLSLPASLGTWLAGGTVAALFGPLRSILKKRTERILTDRLPVTVLAETGTKDTTVCFSDLVGYTRLSAEDEKTALTVLSVFHRVSNRAANQHKGRVVKTIGDACMLEFANVDRALVGASSLHRTFAEACDLLGLPAQELRTGIHHGPATRAPDGDLFGETVNLASRLQGAAEPGQILISETVVAAMSDPDRQPILDLGAKGLKNVPEPVRLFALQPGQASD